jgi:hypothetical protein
MDKNNKTVKEEFLALVKDVKDFFHKEFAPAQTFEAVLKDGTTIQSDTEPLAVGAAVTVNTPEGPAALPDGEYPVVVDGAEMILICAGGFVTELKPVEAPAEEPKTDEEMGDENKFAAALKELETKWESRFAALEEALKISKKNEMASQEKFSKMKDLHSKTLELIEGIANHTSNPVTNPEKKLKEEPVEKKMEKFRKENGLI